MYPLQWKVARAVPLANKFLTRCTGTGHHQGHFACYDMDMRKHIGPFEIIGYQATFSGPTFEGRFCKSEVASITEARREAWRFLWVLRCHRVEVHARGDKDPVTYKGQVLPLFMLVREWPLLRSELELGQAGLGNG